MSFYVCTSKNRNPYFNLAFEEYLFSEFPKKENDVYLVFYENKRSVILGKNLQLEKEVFIHKKKPPVLRRCSGGGSVVHFEGNLNFGLIVNSESHKDFLSIQGSYKIILEQIVKSLNSPKMKFVHEGISDLCLESNGQRRKISGNAQVRRKKWLLHHGTFLYRAEHIQDISYFLRHPPKEPGYREGKKHSDFLIRYLPQSFAPQIRQKIIRQFSVYFGQNPRQFNLDSAIKKETRNFMNRNLKQMKIS